MTFFRGAAGPTIAKRAGGHGRDRIGRVRLPLLIGSICGLVGCEPAYLDAVLAPEEPDAAGTICPDGQQLCSGLCVSVASDPAHCGRCDRACEPTLVCSLGNCTDHCAGSLTSCNGACVDLLSDDDHCGRCDRRCLGAAWCELGECVCPGQGSYCDGSCVNTNNSHAHCGDCETRCASGQSCIDGRCR